MSQSRLNDHAYRIAAITISASLFCLAAVSSSLAIGLQTADNNARATAQGEAFTAQADDASAIYYNPAGLTQLTGTEVQVGAMLWIPDWRVHETSGANESLGTLSLLPHFYAASDFGLTDWRFGLGVQNDFGIGEDWGDSGPLRFVATKAQLTVLDFAPTVAYKVNEHLSLGASLKVYYGSAELDRDVMLGPSPVPVAKYSFKGEGEGVGGTFSLLWMINSQNSVGIVYRTPFNIDLAGSANLDSSVAQFGRSPTSLDINFPQMVTVGYAYRPMEILKLEADVEWVNWDMLNTPQFHSSNPAYNGSTLPFNWMDTIKFKLGAEYLLSEHWSLRAGYAYCSNTVPTSTFSPLVPDSDLHTLSAGFGYSTGRWGVDFAYQIDLWVPRTVQNSGNSPEVDGNWDNLGNAIVITTTIKL